MFQDDNGVVFVDARGGLGGGDFNVEIGPGIPITAIIDRGELSIELTTAADIDACVAAGEVSIGVPAGAYDIDLQAGVGKIAVELEDQDGAEHYIRACTGAGEIDLHVTDPEALEE